MRHLSPAINKCLLATHQWIMFITESYTVMPKTAEQNLIVLIRLPEAEVTNNKNNKKTALEVLYCWSYLLTDTKHHKPLCDIELLVILRFSVLFYLRCANRWFFAMFIFKSSALQMDVSDLQTRTALCWAASFCKCLFAILNLVN